MVSEPSRQPGLCFQHISIKGKCFPDNQLEIYNDNSLVSKCNLLSRIDILDEVLHHGLEAGKGLFAHRLDPAGREDETMTASVWQLDCVAEGDL